jgi:hypothetical protein
MEPKKYQLEIGREWKSQELYINKTYCFGTLPYNPWAIFALCPPLQVP